MREDCYDIFKPSVKIIPYFITQYSWILVVFCLYLLPQYFCFPYYQNTITPSDYTTNWNLSADPIVFAHLSDIHLGAKSPKTVIPQFEQAKDWILTVMKPKSFIITGDTVHNLPEIYARQSEDEIGIYRQEIRDITDMEFIDMAGNHDEFAVLDFYSKNHLFVQGKNLTYEQFMVSRRNYTYNNKKYYFIVLNPYKYPSPHANYIYYPNYDRKFMDLLEKAYEGITKDDILLVFCHYPLCFFDEKIKSSKGHSIYDLVRDSDFPTYFISGHEHPEKPYIIHHKKNLEIIGVDLRRNNCFGSISFDHNRFVYSHFNNTEPNNFIVTSPVPYNLITKNNPFNEQNSYIRVRSYSVNPPNITVTGNVSTKLNCRKANDDNGFVCSAPYNLPKGMHTIQFSGDFSYELKFNVNSKHKFSEIPPEDAVYKHYIYQFIILYISILIMIIPFAIPKKAKDLEELITKGTHSPNYFACIIYAPFIFKARFKNLSWKPKLMYFIATAWVLFMPISFTDIDGHLGIIWLYGTVIDGKFAYDVWSQYFGMRYVQYVLIPFILAMTSVSVNVEFCGPTSIIDFAIIFYIMKLEVDLTLYSVLSSSGFRWTMFSFCFVIMPMIFSIILLMMKFKSKSLDEKQLSDVDVLLFENEHANSFSDETY